MSVLIVTIVIIIIKTWAAVGTRWSSIPAPTDGLFHKEINLVNSKSHLWLHLLLKCLFYA